MKKQLLNFGVAIAATILFAGYALAQHEAPIRVASVPFADASEMVMDGIADEASWGTAMTTWEPFNNAGVESDADFSGSIQLCFDWNNIYIFVNVTDDVEESYAGTGDSYTFDCVEIFLDVDTTITNADGSYIGDEAQIRYQRSDTDIEGTAARNSADMSNYAIVNGGTSWQLECAIPWVAFAEEGKSNQDMVDWLTAGNVIGFDCQLADNDGSGRDGQFMWDADVVGEGTTEDNAWKDTRAFGVIELEVPSAVRTASANSFNVYPNPASGVVNFNNVANVNTIEIVNLVGQMVKVVDVAGNSVAVNVADLASGNYFARLNTTTGVEVVRFVVK